MRRTLFELGGIQSIVALSSDPTFSQTSSKYDRASYERLCAEFGIDPSSYFRFTHGANHGPGKVFIYIGGVGTAPTFLTIPREHAQCSNEGGSASDGNLAYFIRNNEGTGTQFDHYVTEASDGLTQEGLARLNLTAIYKLIYIDNHKAGVRFSKNPNTFRAQKVGRAIFGCDILSESVLYSAAKCSKFSHNNFRKKFGWSCESELESNSRTQLYCYYYFFELRTVRKKIFILFLRRLP